jgi:hypothetical protein
MGRFRKRPTLKEKDFLFRTRDLISVEVAADLANRI